MSQKNRLLFFLFFLCLSSVRAQQNENSPYSRYGIGDITDNNLNHLRQMGGLGASYLDGYHINIVNPASYAFLNATAFDLGVFAKHTWLSDKDNTSKIWSGNLDYMSLAFPLRNPINELYDGVKRKYKLAMAFTLIPHSTVNYNIAVRDSVPGSDPFNRNYRGSGGSYKLMWGNAIRWADFSFGVNLGYLFGRLAYDNVVAFSIPAYAYSDNFSNSYNINGFLWNTGLMYTRVLNKGAIEKNKMLPAQRISLGLHAGSATGMNTRASINHRLEQALPGGITNIDTVRIVNDVKGSGRLPAEIGLGATWYGGERWAMGINYASTFWSDYFNEASGEAKGSLKDGSKLSVGGYFRPDYKSFDNFFERIYYRMGAFYHVDPRVINTEQITTYGVSLGFGIPFVFQRKVSHLNVGVQGGVKGKDTPVSENFVKFNFGVTFNDDEWFLKRKYN
jgi:hypothetical protein